VSTDEKSDIIGRKSKAISHKML